MWNTTFETSKTKNDIYIEKIILPEPWWTLEMTNRIDLFIMKSSLKKLFICFT